MAKPTPQTHSTLNNPYSSRMVVAFRYGSLAIAGIGLGWALAFAAMGSWTGMALEIGVFAAGLFIYMVIKRGHLTFGVLAGQAALIAIAVIMGLFLDVPTADAPRISHLYLLAVAALGYLNYQRQKSHEQLALIGICLTAFVVLSSASLTSPFAEMPEIVRTSGTWINAIMATAMLAACIHAMQADFVRKDKFGRDLMAALWNNEFHLVFQPQVDGTQRTIGAEALLRWNSPQRGPVSPVEFIPEAEKLGLMIAIGSWVLEKGCSTLADWGKSPLTRELTLSINVSAGQLMHPGFEGVVRDTLVKTRANPKRLVLELTESVLVTEIELVIAKLTALRDLGITISLDDFGTGYSSLSYLRRLPIQQIKIDRSFVQDAVNNPSSATLARNVVLMSRDLGHTVLAEGVETIEQHALLAQFGCVEFQGYYYGKPMELADFEQRLEIEATSPAPVYRKA